MLWLIIPVNNMRNEQTTIIRLVKSAVGNEQFEKALYRKNSGTLSNRDQEWEHIHLISNLPMTNLKEWEGLLVYTDESVYRWIESGFGKNPTRVPRNPGFSTKSTS